MELRDVYHLVILGAMGPLRSLGEWIDRWSAHGESAHRAGSLDKTATLDALEQLRHLPTNWNGYNAGPIDAQIIDAAKKLMRAIPTGVVTTPRVVPMTRGRLQFEWHRGNRSLEIEVESADRIHYLKWDTDEGVEEESTLPITEIDRIKRLLDWFGSE